MGGCCCCCCFCCFWQPTNQPTRRCVVYLRKFFFLSLSFILTNFPLTRSIQLFFPYIRYTMCTRSWYMMSCFTSIYERYEKSHHGRLGISIINWCLWMFRIGHVKQLNELVTALIMPTVGWTTATKKEEGRGRKFSSFTAYYYYNYRNIKASQIVLMISTHLLLFFLASQFTAAEPTFSFFSRSLNILRTYLVVLCRRLASCSWS